MGYGEVVGNESVHWTVVHEDDAGVPVKMARKVGAAAAKDPKKAHHVHVDKSCKGCDPQVLAEVGKRKGHTGHYRVRLRFKRKKDAVDAAAALRQKKEDGMYVLILDVPVIHRHDPSDPPPPEIRIDW